MPRELSETKLMDSDKQQELQLGQFIPLHYHYVMLQDELRMNGFQSAIQRSVLPGMRVLELGGGTGVLSYFAAQCGGDVVCVERNPTLVETAQRLLKQNGMREQVSVVKCDAMDYIPDAPVDVVICEMLHVGMLRERQLDVIKAFKQNYRKKFGFDEKLPRFIPEASVLMVQAVDQTFDFNGYQAAVPLFQALDREHESVTKSLSPLTPYSLISYDETFPTQFDVNVELAIESHGNANALRLVTQNILAVDIDAQSAISWPNQALILPIRQQTVSQGTKLNASFQYKSGDSLELLSDSLEVTPYAANAHRCAA